MKDLLIDIERLHDQGMKSDLIAETLVIPIYMVMDALIMLGRIKDPMAMVDANGYYN